MNIKEVVSQNTTSAQKLDAQVKKLLLKRSYTLVELSNKLNVAPRFVEESVERLKAQSHNVTLAPEGISIEKVPQQSAERLVVNSRDFVEDGEWRKFGALGDTHLASKYARLDVLRCAYKIYESEGITAVYHTGNIIDGECRFNKHDLVTRSGMAAQVEYLINEYPQMKGIVTYFVVGDDHEGWWTQREGIDVGAYIEAEAEKAGRNDLKYIGYLERDIELKARRGSAAMRVMHSGGGAAYAVSYTTQKIVECVPLESEILTREGWKKYSEIVIGQDVLGYNIEADRCEWTRLKDINLYADAEVVEYRNDQFSIKCTRNHRWAIEWQQRGGKNPKSKIPTNYIRKQRIFSSIEDSKERSRIIQSAQAPDGAGLEVNGHAEIVERTGAVGRVMQMTSAQRQSFIYGMMIGEGSLSGSGNTPVFSQRPGPVQDAFVLACFLEGKGIGIARQTTKKINGEDKVCCRTTVLKKRLRMITKSLREVGSSRQPVWCPTTGLGTWVMRQGETITITGNSLQGGEKPRILLVGHHHKYEHGYPREVHVVQTATTEDQTPFMRKNKIQAHVGFTIDKFHQADTGEINRFASEFVPFYDRDFYYKGEKYRRW